jgi:hypothetical protein
MIANRTVKTIKVAGANLFQIAAIELGDATQWNRLAAANGLTDFIVVGPATLVIPPIDKSVGNGGILGA